MGTKLWLYLRENYKNEISWVSIFPQLLPCLCAAFFLSVASFFAETLPPTYFSVRPQTLAKAQLYLEVCVLYSVQTLSLLM